jgi:phosphoglycolate phosphatase-like HAD superfamily hydrolase
VLFDLDGVLIQSHEVWFALLNAAAREQDAPEVTRELFEATWGQGITNGACQLELYSIVRLNRGHYNCRV